MKNYEKYKDLVIDSVKIDSFCDLAKMAYGDGCPADRKCSECMKRVSEWLDEEFKPQCKPRIDWSKVPVDTPVIVKEKSGIERRRHFCKYRPNVAEPFVCFNDGKTSFTGDTTTYWDNCELARKEDIEKYSI